MLRCGLIKAPMPPSSAFGLKEKPRELQLKSMTGTSWFRVSWINEEEEEEEEEEEKEEEEEEGEESRLTWTKVKMKEEGETDKLELYNVRTFQLYRNPDRSSVPAVHLGEWNNPYWDSW